MKKLMLSLAIVFSATFIALTISYALTGIGVLLTLAITFGTTAYHFDMRLAVGCAIMACMNNKAHYRRAWYRVRPSEKRFHELIKVHKWKKHIPSYDASFFDLRAHSIEEIIMATCQAELVHEIIMVLSLVPLLLIIWFGTPAAFITTSVVAFLLDSIFVIVQRYNRPRLMRLLEKSRK